MAKAKTVFFCQNCGFESAKWMGQCPGCREWNTFAEEPRAALCAVRLCPEARGFLIPSHASAEPGYRAAMEALGLEPLFNLRMRLGEGSGCPIAMMMLDAAAAVMRDMATFAEAGIDDGYLDSVREEGV